MTSEPRKICLFHMTCEIKYTTVPQSTFYVNISNNLPPTCIIMTDIIKLDNADVPRVVFCARFCVSAAEHVGIIKNWEEAESAACNKTVFILVLNVFFLQSVLTAIQRLCSSETHRFVQIWVQFRLVLLFQCSNKPSTVHTNIVVGSGVKEDSVFLSPALTQVTALFHLIYRSRIDSKWI